MSASEKLPRPLEGSLVTPTVRLVSALDSGGMGAVWLAEHTGLKTKVVVKFMLDDLGASASARSRFSREAAAAAKVKSPHVVQMLDHGVTEDGVPFIVMEHLEGRDLGAVLRDRESLSPDEVVAIVEQLAKALARVHAADLLHRDIKPENIFLCEGDEIFVKLLDFGIAKSNAEVSLDTQTKTGQVVGTPYYMSPEQMMGQREIDARSDLWSLGIVVYECLTGKRPFDGPSFGAIAVSIATTAATPLSELRAQVPVAVDTWFQKACAREPQRRFGTAKELADGLRAAFGKTPQPPSLVATTGDHARPDLSLASTVVEGKPLHEGASGERPLTPRSEVSPAREPAKPARVDKKTGVVVAGLALLVGAGLMTAVMMGARGKGQGAPSTVGASAPKHVAAPSVGLPAVQTPTFSRKEASSGEAHEASTSGGKAHRASTTKNVETTTFDASTQETAASLNPATDAGMGDGGAAQGAAPKVPAAPALTDGGTTASVVSPAHDAGAHAGPKPKAEAHDAGPHVQPPHKAESHDASAP